MHYIEVVSNEDSKVDEPEPKVVADEVEHEDQGREHLGGMLAALSGAPRYHSFRVRGILQGQRVTVLIDIGATHNFIDKGLVAVMITPDFFLFCFSRLISKQLIQGHMLCKLYKHHTKEIRKNRLPTAAINNSNLFFNCCYKLQKPRTRLEMP